MDDDEGHDVRIRAERAEDHDAIRSVITSAFKSPVEARLVEEIRGSPYFIADLALVAEVDGDVVGHVMVSYTDMHDGEQRHRIHLLSPLAVTHAFQHRGIGSGLVMRVTELADDAGAPLVILEGEPGFYGRLGFEHSVPHGILIDLPSWAPPEAAQILRLRSYEPSVRGKVVFPPAFAALGDH
ncbi:MAG: N-acetyltransferase [Acidimicrobiales bacterium]